MNEHENQSQHESHDELSRVVEPEIVKMSATQRMFALLASPGELMRNVKAYPVILAPFLLAVVLGLLTIPVGLAITEISMVEMRHIFTERYPTAAMNPFDMDALAGEYGDLPAADIVGMTVIITSVIGAFAFPFIIGFFATLGIFILSKILRGPAKFGQTFSMYLHVYVLYALGLLVAQALMVATGSFVDVTSIAPLLMPQGNISQPMYVALMSISVFSIWYTVITFIGVKVINDFCNTKAAIITIITFAAWIGINAVLSTFSWRTFDAMYAAGLL